MKKSTNKSTQQEEPKQENAQKNNSWEETFHVSGEDMIKKVKELMKEANVRRIIVKDKKGDTLAEFPLALGAVITVLVPVLAAVGALAALLSECSITVIREKK
jgi:hypothetical protein